MGGVTGYSNQVSREKILLMSIFLPFLPIERLQLAGTKPKTKWLRDSFLHTAVRQLNQVSWMNLWTWKWSWSHSNTAWHYMQTVLQAFLISSCILVCLDVLVYFLKSSFQLLFSAPLQLKICSKHVGMRSDDKDTFSIPVPHIIVEHLVSALTTSFWISEQWSSERHKALCCYAVIQSADTLLQLLEK